MVVVSGYDKNCWYAAGLYFECLKCGRCCSGPAGGYIWVSRPEIRLIAGHLNMSVKEVKDRFLKRQGLRMTIIEDASTRDCVFLQETQEGKRCMIYSVRPAQCRSWPFWPTNLAGPDNWNFAAQRCPGINRGQAYTPEQIQTRQNTKHWWRPVLRSSPDESRSSILPDKTSSQGTNAGNGATAKDGNENNNDLIQQVQDIYNWLDEQLESKSPECALCGKCCDFESFDHRLFVTTPEIMFFTDKLGPGNIKKMTAGRCPYRAVAPDGETSPKGGAEGKCTVYPYRFAGCRIFNCKGDADFQSDLTETVIKKFKSLCEEFDVPYRYLDLPTALSTSPQGTQREIYMPDADF